MRVLIIGATGLLGRDLCARLAECHDLTGWARRTPTAASPEVRRMESVEIADREAVLHAMGRVHPDAVIHTAAMSDVDACERDPASACHINVVGTENIALGCRQTGAFLMAISTDYVFDGALSRPYQERDPAHPISVYGQSKWDGEQEALNTAPRCLIVRVSGLFGAGRPNFVTGTIENFKAGRPVRVVTDQTNSPSYTVDLAEGISRLLEMSERTPQETESGQQLHGPLHLANAGGASRLDVARTIARHLGASESLIEKTTWAALNRPARRPANSVLDCSRFVAVGGVALRPWHEALKEFLHSGILDQSLFP